MNLQALFTENEIKATLLGNVARSPLVNNTGLSVVGP